MFVYYGQCIYGFFVGYEILNSTAKCSINLDDHINDCGVIKRKSQLEKPKFARKPLNDMAFANSLNPVVISVNSSFVIRKLPKRFQQRKSHWAPNYLQVEFATYHVYINKCAIIY